MLRTLWLSVVLVAAVSWANPPQTFTQGSLIIPMQANFQNECGMASAYGLVWKILYENRAGGAFAGSPVTVYWAIQGAKTSTNRCVPTNKHATALNTVGVGIAAGKAGWNAGVLNDGCDFYIENSGRQPVVPVDWNVGFPVGNIYNNNTIPQFDATAAGQPYYDSAAPAAGKGQRPAALDNSGTCTVVAGDEAPCGATRFTRVQYSGGAFVIDASDAKRVIDAINGAYPHLNQHKSISNAHCGGLLNGGASVGTFSTVTGAGGQVIIHQATTSFDAPIYKRITNTPPRIALVDFGGGTSSVLLQYLTRARLQGDASGNIGGQKVCGTPGAVGGIANCAVSTTGLIYDRIRGLDDLLTTGTYPKGLINSKVGGKSRYKVIWAPHWELDNSDKSSGAATNAERGNALDNLDYFGDQKGNGLLAECASIEGYEGSSAVPQYSGTGLGKFMFNGNIRRNGMTLAKHGRNCTDPWYNGTSMCTVYGAPSDPFSQVGDYTYAVGGGHVESFTNLNNGVDARKPGVKRLASSWSNYPTGADNTGNNGWDYATLRQKDDDPEKATVIYVAGHNLSNDPAGTRIVLNTLLNLGADPIPSDRNYTAGVGFMDVTNANAPTFVSSIYSVISGTLLPGAITYDKANGKNWMWPYTGGNVRIRNAATLSAGENELTDSVIANADGEMPLPSNRNLFTYFGGQTVVNPALSGSRKVRNGVAQLGWVPERLEHTRLNDQYGTSPNPNCVDVQQWGDYKDKVSGVNTSGLVPGPDGICDLQQALVWSNFAWVVGGGGNHSIPPGHLNQLQNEVPEVQQFIQRVRGYCFADTNGSGIPGPNGPIMEPTDANCVDMGGFGDNRAHIGGAVRSSAAIVPPSPKIIDNGAARPTVAYVGTWDGQLHAIYVGGGAGYTGPVTQRPHLNADAVCTAAGTTACSGGAINTFKTNWGAGAFAPPNRGTELWSFMPASQLAWLKSNSARVDSSPVVQDVFVDLYGTGVRTWHTVLVVSLGGTGRELFAFDITNPLKPALLWDIVGSTYQVGAFPDYSGVSRSDFDLTGAARPTEWLNTTAEFVLPPVADPGRSQGYAYDFTDLGGSRSLAIGQMREGLEPTYAVFVASNSSGVGGGGNDAAGRNLSKALNVFAIDVATGQKIWQWRQPYVVDVAQVATYRAADNTVPPPVSVLNTAEGAGILYVGDMEGRVWELNATTGQNMNAFRDTAAPACAGPACNYPLYDTRGSSMSPEPITSNLAIGRLPGTIAAGTPFTAYRNEPVMLLGTGGADWVPAATSGNLHAILLNNTRRKPLLLGNGTRLDATTGSGFGATPWSISDARSSAAGNFGVYPGAGDLGGVAQSAPGPNMPWPFGGGNRVYGNLTITGNTVFVPLVTGAGSDPMNVAKDQAGKTLEMPLGSLPVNVAGAAMTGYNYANYGGVAVFEVGPVGAKDVWIVGDQVGKTAAEKNTTGTQKATDTVRNPALTAQPTVPYRLYNAVRRFFSQQ